MADTDNAQFIRKLADLGEMDVLAIVAVTATLAGDGTLGRVEGVRQKIDGMLSKPSSPVVGLVGLAAAQDDILKNPHYRTHLDGSATPQLMEAGSFAELVDGLHGRLRGRHGVVAIDYLRDLGPSYQEYVQAEDWLFSKIATALGTPFKGNEGCPYRVLVCGPGVGKTAFALELIRRRHRLGPMNDWLLGGWHILRRGRSDWSDSRTLVEQIELRLRRNLACPLNARDVEVPIDNRNCEELLHAALSDAAHQAEKTGKGLLILVDGLDEAFGQNALGADREHHLLTLFPNPADLPGNVRILFTSRPGSHLQRWLGSQRHAAIITLDADRARIDWDIRRHLVDRLAQPAGQLGLTEEATDSLLGRMVESCEGVFIVARFLAREAQDMKRLDAWASEDTPLPRGIDEMLEQDWNWKARLLKGKNKKGLMQVLGATLALWQQAGAAGDRGAVMALLVEVGNAAGRKGDKPPQYVGNLPRMTLAKRDWVDEVLHRLEDWFEGATDATLRFHHTRIPEVLLEKLVPTDTINGLHQLLAWRGRQWPELPAGRARQIALALAPWHGALSGNHDELERAMQMLIDPVYLQAAYDALGIQTQGFLDASFEIVRDRLQDASPGRCLWDVRRSLTQHDGILADGSLRVAAALYNDLGGLDTDNYLWRKGLVEQAHHDGLVRRQPGQPSAFLRFLNVGAPAPSVAVSCCGRWLAVAAGYDIVLYRVEAGEYRVQLAARVGGHQDTIDQLAFSPLLANGRLWLASASEDHTVGLLSVGPAGPLEDKVQCIEGHGDEVMCVVFSPEIGGRLWLASASRDYTVGLLPVGPEGPLKSKVQRVEGHRADVWHVAFSPEIGGRLWLASASRDHTVGLLSVGPAGPLEDKVQCIEGHGDDVKCVVFSPEIGGRLWLASASRDDAVGLLPVGPDGPLKSEVQCFRGHGNYVNEVAFFPKIGGRLWLASASLDHSVGLLPISSEGQIGDKVECFQGHRGRVNHVAFSPRFVGRLWLASASRDGTVGLLRVGPEGLLKDMIDCVQGHGSHVLDVAFSPVIGDRLWLGSASLDYTVGLLPVGPEGRLKDKVERFEGHKNSVDHVTFSPEIGGRLWLASISVDSTVGLLPIGPEGPLRNKIQCFKGHGDFLGHVAFSPEIGGRLWLASASYDHTVGLLPVGPDGPLRSRIQCIEGHGDFVLQVIFSPKIGGRLWLASASRDGTVGLLPVGSDGPLKDKVQRFQGPGGSVRSIAFSPKIGDRLWLASGSNDNTVGLLEILSSGPVDGSVRVLRGHRFPVHLLRFGPTWGEDVLLASASQREVILWSIPEGRLLARADFSGTGEVIHDLAWNRDSRLLHVAGLRNGTQVVYLTLILPPFLSD